MSKNLTIALTAIVIILIATVGFLAFQNQQLTKNLAKESPPPVSSSPTPSPKLTLAQVQENIEASVNSGNTAALASSMSDPVIVLLQATECCGPQTPDEAVNQLSYIKEGAPFDFNQNLLPIPSLKTKNPELTGKFIGISKSGEHLIALGINAQNRITDIRMSVSWKLFSY